MKARPSLSAVQGDTRPRMFTGRYSRGVSPPGERWTNSQRGFGGTLRSDMRAVETNLLVRLIARDDSKQVAAAEAFVERGAWVSHLALVEATWVLSAVYELDAAGIATALEMLLNHKTLTVQDSEVVSAALGHFLKHPSLGFSDCMQLEIARKAGHLPLGSFDRRLARLPDVERL